LKQGIRRVAGTQITIKPLKGEFNMSENTENKPKRGRGRPADPNKPKKERREATGRKYFVTPGDAYQNFINSLGEYGTPFQSKEAALAAADKYAEAAEEAGNPNISLALFEEVGSYGAKIEKKVVRKLISSRTITRGEKAENPASESQDSGTTVESTESEPEPEPEVTETPRSRRSRH
jgi:hypothetical protein